MLSSPSHAVVGATDLASSIAFLEIFGFEENGRGVLPSAASAALYGLDGAADEVQLGIPGAERGWIRLVGTTRPQRHFEPLDNRAFAVDLFSTNLERSIALAEEAGHRASPIATHQFGPISIREVEIAGPDHLIVTLLEQGVGRRPSVLDADSNRLHSELHAFVWSVKNTDDLLPFWQQKAGLETLTDAAFDSPDIGAVLGVPDREIKLRLVVLADDQSSPARLELIEFIGESAADHPNFPLCGGLHAPAFTVANLDDARSRLEGAEWSAVVELDSSLHPETRAVSSVAPGNLRFELWQEGHNT